MALTVPSREDLFDAFIADYAGAQPAKNVSRGSDPHRLGRVVSGSVWAIIARLLFFEKQMLPDTAEAEFLERWGSVYSFPRLAATGAIGEAALEVTGTAGTSVPNGTQLTHKDGTIYQVTSTGASIGLDGTVIVDVAAISTGLSTNKSTGEILTFSSPPTNVDSTATLVGDLIDGTDIETYDAYRVRLLAHIGDPPEGGAIHDYIEWVSSIAGVQSAFVWVNRRGLGTVDVAGFSSGTGTARVLAETIRDNIFSYIDSVRPANVADFKVLETTPQTQDVTCTIDIDDQVYGWDWDDAGIGYTISAHDEGAMQITVSGMPATVVAGVRIQVLGEEATVVSRSVDNLVLSFENDFDGNAVTWFSFDPDGEELRASGDLVRPVKNAILKLFDTLGPARSSYAGTSWTSDLRLSKLFAAISDVTGVDDATITTPSATVAPDDTFEDTVPFLIPGAIQVLKPA